MCWYREDAKGTWMRIPDYPSNREADEMARMSLFNDGKAPE
jgi:hypothetical protein